MGQVSRLQYEKLKFFNSISYVVRKNSESVRVRVNVGDVVDILDNSFAKVVAIIRHQANDKRYVAFFLVQWFSAFSHSHALLNCPVYVLERSDGTWPNSEEWHRIFSPSAVDHTPRVHFVHDCGRECTRERHDSENRRYIRNDFFYHAI
jgi:hypothetical protein